MHDGSIDPFKPLSLLAFPCQEVTQTDGFGDRWFHGGLQYDFDEYNAWGKWKPGEEALIGGPLAARLSHLGAFQLRSRTDYP
jgi:hypothetical protein